MVSFCWTRWFRTRSEAESRRRHHRCQSKSKVTVEALEDRTLLATIFRTIDGTGNNVQNPDWGAANIQLVRAGAPVYGDGISTPSGADRPNPRLVSNAVAVQTTPVFNNRNLSDFVWQWGQFLDHDLDLTTGTTPDEPLPIAVPAGDPQFDPMNTGTQVIGFNRSVYDPLSGTMAGNPRQQINQITAYIDASNVYGSDTARANALRTFQGGELKTSTGNLLPFNTAGLPNANGGPVPNDQLFLAGDVRANEQIGLTSMHTLFVREHNRVAQRLARSHPNWTDEQLYQWARKIVGAEMQVITYNEFLPALLGREAPSRQQHYKPSTDASVRNEFSTALYRVGHTMLSPQLQRIQNDGSTAPAGPLNLAQAFFNPANLATSADLDNLLKGLASQRMQEIDTMVVDAVRNFLFGPPGAGGMDLASLNIQRGRDHGLPDYNTIRQAFGLQPVASFAQITSNVALQNALAAVYGDVGKIDPWVGALAEDHMRGSSVGPLLSAALNDQFSRLRDGDRFWFKHDPSFSRRQIAQLRSTRLSDIIRRNTGITNIQRNVFFAPTPVA